MAQVVMASLPNHSGFTIWELPSVHPVNPARKSNWANRLPLPAFSATLPDRLENTNIKIALESFTTSGMVILHGPSGSGKTRLMQAAACYFSMQKGLDILNCCILDLIQEMVEAIKEAAYTAFRASLMRRDALFIDNIWLLQGRPQTACEVFSLFESFAGKGGLVMIASDLPLSQLRALRNSDFHTCKGD